MEQRQDEVWTITKIIAWTKQYFTDKGVDNPRLDAEILLCAVLNCPRIDLYVYFDRPLSRSELQQYRSYVTRRGAREPVAYILGERSFHGLSLKVTPQVLIPRPETELLAEGLAALFAAAGPVRFLDIGTGSGAISLALLKLLPEAEATALDISAAALAIAEENAADLAVAERFHGLRSDLYAALPQGEKFDFIVTNPPYIPTAVLAELAPEVRLEPQLALDGGADGLDFYRRIVAGGEHYLVADGLLAMEIGFDQAEEVAAMCTNAGLASVKVQKDYAGLDRMVFAARKGSKYENKLLALR